jgi:hypothetical protein
MTRKILGWLSGVAGKVGRLVGFGNPRHRQVRRKRTPRVHNKRLLLLSIAHCSLSCFKFKSIPCINSMRFFQLITGLVSPNIPRSYLPATLPLPVASLSVRPSDVLVSHHRSLGTASALHHIFRTAVSPPNRPSHARRHQTKTHSKPIDWIFSLPDSLLFAFLLSRLSHLRPQFVASVGEFIRKEKRV